jgi:hypothetical protein
VKKCTIRKRHEGEKKTAAHYQRQKDRKRRTMALPTTVAEVNAEFAAADEAMLQANAAHEGTRQATEVTRRSDRMIAWLATFYADPVARAAVANGLAHRLTLFAASWDPPI